MSKSKSRIREGKQNRVTITAEKSTREIIYSNVFTYFNLVFVILAILLILVRSWNNMLFVPIVVVNSLIGIVQELRSRRILNKMRLLQVEKARVIREGERLDLPVDQVVEGMSSCSKQGIKSMRMPRFWMARSWSMSLN